MLIVPAPLRSPPIEMEFAATVPKSSVPVIAALPPMAHVDAVVLAEKTDVPFTERLPLTVRLPSQVFVVLAVVAPITRLP